MGRRIKKCNPDIFKREKSSLGLNFLKGPSLLQPLRDAHSEHLDLVLLRPDRRLRLQLALLPQPLHIFERAVKRKEISLRLQGGHIFKQGGNDPIEQLRQKIYADVRFQVQSKISEGSEDIMVKQVPQFWHQLHFLVLTPGSATWRSENTRPDLSMNNMYTKFPCL